MPKSRKNNHYSENLNEMNTPSAEYTSTQKKKSADVKRKNAEEAMRIRHVEGLREQMMMNEAKARKKSAPSEPQVTTEQPATTDQSVTTGESQGGGIKFQRAGGFAKSVKEGGTVQGNLKAISDMEARIAASNRGDSSRDRVSRLASRFSETRGSDRLGGLYKQMRQAGILNPRDPGILRPNAETLRSGGKKPKRTFRTMMKGILSSLGDVLSGSYLNVDKKTKQKRNLRRSSMEGMINPPRQRKPT